MSLDRIFSANPDADLIAPNAAALVLWEAVLHAGQADRRQAWPTPNIRTFRQWLQSRWDVAHDGHASLGERSLLTAAQAARLWQQVVETSPESAALIGIPGLADRARSAARTLFDYGIGPNELRASDWSGANAAFVGWYCAYQRLLDRNGWIDPDSLLYTLNRLPLTGALPELLLLDPPAATPELERLTQRWQEHGSRVETVLPDDHAIRFECRLAATPDDELEQVAELAVEILGAAPESRIAVVVPELARCRREIELTFAGRAGHLPLSFPQGIPVADHGIFGGALAALRMLTPGADFGALSRCLRSPFFARARPDYRERAARLERRLRGDLRAQGDFPEAYRRYGLRAVFHQELPEAAQAVDAAFERLPEQATPTGWAQAWQACLRQLDWAGFDTSLDPALHAAWDGAWGRFAELTAVTGTLSAATALTEFERVLGRETVFEPISLAGVHFVSRVEDVGPGYAAAWVCGFSERGWPEPVPANPLLPRALRHRLRMPGTRPAADLAAAGIRLDALQQRVPLTVFSCPVRVLDRPQMPNARFRDWQPVASGSSIDATGTIAAETCPELEELADPPPPLAGETVPGSVRTLDLQSACPVRAFADSRLGAEALEQPVRGIDPRTRGILLHRALELLFAHDDAATRRARLVDSVRQSFAVLLPAGDRNRDALAAAERARTIRLLEALLKTDEARAPFRVEARELPGERLIGNRRLRCRIDRIDVLADGERVLLDYKTGRHSTSDWFGERLGNVQLPLYAMDDAAPVAAIAIVGLVDQGAEYGAAGAAAGGLPGRQRLFEAEEWTAQLARWREQLTGLVDEFGAVRIRLAGAALADGPYAALTRIRRILR